MLPAQMKNRIAAQSGFFSGGWQSVQRTEFSVSLDLFAKTGFDMKITHEYVKTVLS
jgi:hypothetical protein